MSIVAIDTETFLLAPGMASPPIVCLQFSTGDTSAIVHSRDPRFNTAVEALLEPGVKVVAHNGAAFEFLVLLSHNSAWRGRLFDKLKRGEWSDTLIRERLLRIAKGDRREGFALDECLKAHGLPAGETMDKSCYWRLRYGLLWDKPISEWPKEAVDYAAGDLAVLDLWHAQQAQGDRYFKNEAAQVEAAVALALSGAWGLRTDPENARKLYESTVADIERDKITLAQAGLLKFDGKGNASKNKKLAEERLVSAYEAKGLDAPRGEPTEAMKAAGKPGNVRLDETACLESGDEALAAYTRYGQANTLLSKAKRFSFPLIQVSYVTPVNTGRTSCRMGSDPKPGEAWIAHNVQIQNLPRAPGARECFVARPGHALVSIDVDQHELRVFAQVCLDLLGYSDMAEVLRDPKRCPHVEAGAAVYGISVAEAYALKATDKQKYKDVRQIAKALNFGIFGGLGAGKFVEYAKASYGLDLTEQRARELIQIWKKTWREGGPYLDLISDMLGKRGARTEVTQLRSGRIRGDVGYCDAANGFVQGLASDGAKAAIVALMYEMYNKPDSTIYGCRMLAYVHDEAVLEIPLEGLHEKAFHARDVFCAGLQPFTPDVPITAQPAAMIHWSKRYGDPVFRDGKLIPGEWAT